MRKIFNKILFLAVLAVLLFHIPFNNILGKEPEKATAPSVLEKEDIYKELSLFADAITLINANYTDEVSPKDLMYGALGGMLRSLDSHSNFLTPEDFEEIKIDTEGEFGGLGIEISIRDELLTVITPLEDTPAEKAGLKPGDRIIRIGGESTKGYSLDDAVKKMRGAPGTKVVLTIMREDENIIKDFEIKRGLIRVKSVKNVMMLDDEIGYIRITEFQQDTVRELEKALRILEKKKMAALILDLRNNPGGLLDSAVDVSEKFLPKRKKIVSIKGRVEEQQAEFVSKNAKARTGFPMVTLVNKGSASASEIVAGALKDNKRAITLGTKTFGKGSVQTIIPMRDGSALRLTTSKYFTPSGKAIHGEGVEPDVEIESIPVAPEEEKPKDIFAKLKQDKESEKRKRLMRDNQVSSAMQLLKGIKIYRNL